MVKSTSQQKIMMGFYPSMMLSLIPQPNLHYIKMRDLELKT
ncbi:hypothetical protein [Cylindrospermopsis raciborskii]|nr:hypothetical protein [Cylindrospermopsis raciborskii]